MVDMASIHTFTGLRSTRSSEKVRKPRSKMVKPILKKLTSQSEKNSLDLDRGWDEQDDIYQSWGRTSGSSERPSMGKDVSFAMDEAGGVPFGSQPYRHVRTTSVTSHGSSVATTAGSSFLAGGGGNGSRAGGKFVHPFQQMPGTATPPLSYASSQASFPELRERERAEVERERGRERERDRDCSPTITEQDESYFDNLDPTMAASHSSLAHFHGGSCSNSSKLVGSSQGCAPSIPASNTYSRQHSPSRPSLSSLHSRPRLSFGSQRTESSSFSDINNTHPRLRVSVTANNLRSTSSTTAPALSSRLAHVSSRSDTEDEYALESPTSPDRISLSSKHCTGLSTPTGNMHLKRPSFDGPRLPRLRAKSELDTAMRADQVREARRQFEIEEMRKEAKYARAEVKKREQEETKRALEISKQAAAFFKEQEAKRKVEEVAALAEAMPRDSKHLRKMSSARPRSLSHKLKANLLHRDPDTAATTGGDEGNSQSAQGVNVGTARRRNSAKQRTHNTWTQFVLWLRTRLWKMRG